MSWQTLKQVKQFIAQVNPEVIHTHNEGPLFYGSLAGRWQGVARHIHTFHDTWVFESWGERVYAKLMKLINNATFVVPAADLIADVAAVLPGAEVIAINNGVDLHKFCHGAAQTARQNLKLPANKKIIGCAARLSLEKGHKYLIIALAKLPVDIHLALAGSGPRA